MSLYPNPSTGNLKLSLSELSDRELSLYITDLSGKAVYQQNLESEGPSLDMDLNLSLRPGIYLVSIEGENTLLQEKLIIE